MIFFLSQAKEKMTSTILVLKMQELYNLDLDILVIEIFNQMWEKETRKKKKSI